MITPSSISYTNLNNLLGRTPVYRATITKGPQNIQPPFTWHWPLDETSGTRHSSYSPGMVDVPLSDTGTVGYTTGKHSNCATFNGTTQYLAGTSAAIGLGDVNFWIRAWVYQTSSSGNRAIVGQWGDGASSWVLFYQASVNRYRFQIALDPNASSVLSIDADSFGAPSLNTWYEIRAWRIRNPNGSIYIQVNTETTIGAIDSAVGDGTSYPIYDAAEPLRIGAIRGPSTADLFWPGRIDEVTLSVNYIPTAAEQSILRTAYALPIPNDQYTTYIFDTAHDVSGEPSTAVSALYPVDITRVLDMPYSRFAVSTLTFWLRNLAGADALFIASSAGAAIIFESAFWELPNEDAHLFTGYITEVRAEDGAFVITAQSTLAVAMQSLLFEGAQSQLSTDINANLTTFPVVNSDAFTSAANGVGHGWICVDNEICHFAGTKPGQILTVDRGGSYTFKSLPPIVPNGGKIAHTMGAQVRELVYLGYLTNTNAEGGTNDLHPCDHLKTVVTGVDGTGVLASNKQSVGFTNRMQVNQAELDAFRAFIGAGVQFLFLDDEPIAAKDFLEKEIYLPCAAYPTENAAGEIGIKPYPTESEFSAVDTLDDSHVVSVPKWDRSAEVHINQVIYWYDYMPTTREYLRMDKFVDDAAVALHGRELPLVIYSKGIRSRWDEADYGLGTRRWFTDTAGFLLAAARRHLSRFGSRAAVLRCETILRDNLLECADDVTGIFTNVPDEINSNANINRPFDVVGQRINFETRTVEFQLLEHTDYQSAANLVTT